MSTPSISRCPPKHSVLLNRHIFSPPVTVYTQVPHTHTCHLSCTCTWCVRGWLRYVRPPRSSLLPLPSFFIMNKLDTTCLTSMDSHSIFSAFVHSMDESSSSTSPSTSNSFSSYFASDQPADQPAIMAANAVAAMMPQLHVDTADSSPAMICGCDVYPCCGGSFTVAGFKACEKRPANQKQKLHGRGMVCTIHHEFRPQNLRRLSHK